MHAKNACSDAFPAFCAHLCGFENQHHHLIWRYFVVKLRIMLQKMESANAVFYYESEHFWYHFVSIMKRRRWQIPLLRNTLYYCQENSEFWCHEKARFLKKMFVVGKYAENEHFWKMLSINQFHFLDIWRACQSYAMTSSKLWNEPVRCGIWSRQMPQVSGSKHSYERLWCHMWQFRVWRMRKLERKSRFFTWFSFLDLTEKSTRICK